MPTLDDDRGQAVVLDHVPARVVSLVPSITEALAVSIPERLVGATDWCTHPAGLDVPRVRGTKNPDHQAIMALGPDLVVANQEENRRIDVERLRTAGIPVWVTVTESVDQALGSLERLLVEVLGCDRPEWLTLAVAEWDLPPELAPAAVIVPIWRDPWMVVGQPTFSGDMVARLGLTLLHGHGHGHGHGEERYPKIELSELVGSHPDLVLLPDEPYPFAPDDGPEAFPGIPTALVSGRDLTWYGPSMATARQALTTRVAAVLPSA